MSSAPFHPPTPEEARASLAEIDRIGSRVRKSIAASAASPMLILWGVIWVIGFAGTQAWPDAAGRLWLWLDLVGIVASLIMGGWFRGLEMGDPHRKRIGVSWVILLAYGFVWLLLLIPQALGSHGMWTHLDWGHRIGAFWCEIAMFGYVMMGLWLSRFLLGLGLLVSALTLVGLLLLPGYFYLWMAVMGGGALAAAGFYIRIAWR